MLKQDRIKYIPPSESITRTLDFRKELKQLEIFVFVFFSHFPSENKMLRTHLQTDDLVRGQSLQDEKFLQTRNEGKIMSLPSVCSLPVF